MKRTMLKLNPKGKDIYALAARKAIRVYASSIQFENEKLANELRAWVDKEMLKTKLPKFTTDGRSAAII